MPTTTRRGAALALILAGVVAAFQVGKAAIAVPALQRDLHLALSAAAWVIGAYGMIGAIFGLPAGIVSSLFSARRTMLAGLLAAGFGSIAGGFAGDDMMLVATRVLEGCGLLAASVAIPRLLRSVVAPADLDAVLALWGTYLPIGVAVMMLAGPLVLGHGWQALWFANGAVALGMAAAVAFLRIDEPAPVTPLGAAALRDGLAVLRKPGAWLLALSFGVYVFQSMAMAGLLPTLLVRRMDLPVAAAGVITALTLLANAAGNASAGLLMRFGVPTWAALACGFACTAITSVGIFHDAMPLAAVTALACLNLGITGLIPGSIFAAASRLAATSATLAVALGLINQASNVGSLSGPTAMAAVVERFGWGRAPLLFVAVGAVGIGIALALRPVLRGPSQTP